MFDHHHRISPISIPTGWLVSSDGRFSLFFIRDSTSFKRLPRVITQLWYTEDGMPTRVKNIRKCDLDSAIETWNELVSNGWKLAQDSQEKAL